MRELRVGAHPRVPGDRRTDEARGVLDRRHVRVHRHRRASQGRENLRCQRRRLSVRLKPKIIFNHFRLISENEATTSVNKSIKITRALLLEKTYR